MHTINEEKKFLTTSKVSSSKEAFLKYSMLTCTSSTIRILKSLLIKLTFLDLKVYSRLQMCLQLPLNLLHLIYQ